MELPFAYDDEGVAAFAVQQQPNEDEPPPFSSLNETQFSNHPATMSHRNDLGTAANILPAQSPAVLHQYDNLHSHFYEVANHKDDKGSASHDTEIVEFSDTYVTVCESDEDDEEYDHSRFEHDAHSDTVYGSLGGNILAVLLLQQSSSENNQESKDGDTIVGGVEDANIAAKAASDAMKKGYLEAALGAHTKAAKLFRNAAVSIRESDPSLANSLLLLSKTQANSAISLKRIITKHSNTTTAPQEGKASIEQKNSSSTSGKSSNTSSPTSLLTHQDRLRATVRGAMSTRNEVDMTDSIFLGSVAGGSQPQHTTATGFQSLPSAESDVVASKAQSNPVDDMMALERELRDMDMALALGSSIASLGTRAPSKSRPLDGSFCVVPPGSASFMSSSSLGSSGIISPQHPQQPARPGVAPPVPPLLGTAGGRARANRVQTILATSTATPHPHHHQNPSDQHQSPKQGGNPGLESSWYGGQASGMSHMASSVVSIGGSTRNTGNHNENTNTKQMMRLLESIKTLGDENAALLRERDDAQAARLEAQATREEMKKFKAEYAQRFSSLKGSLEKFQQKYPDGSGTENHVASSDYVKSTSVSEIQKRDDTIRKLTADLEKERKESKTKDSAIRKYENFYREVKARSAEKARQRQQEERKKQQQQPSQPNHPPKPRSRVG